MSAKYPTQLSSRGGKMSGSGRMILEDGCLVEGRFRDGGLHGLARLGGAQIKPLFTVSLSSGSWMPREGWSGWGGTWEGGLLGSVGLLSVGEGWSSERWTLTANSPGMR